MKSLILSLACAIVAACCWTVAVGDLAAQSTLYRAGKVYTMQGEPLSPGAVLVEDGKIAAVGESLEPASGVDLVDLGPNAVLMPGLINAYSQAGVGSGNADERTEEVTPDFSPLPAVDWTSRAMKQQLMRGTTSLGVAPGTENVIAGVTVVVKTAHARNNGGNNVGNNGERVLVDDGPLVVNMCNDPTRGNSSRSRPDSIYVRQPTNRMGVVWILRSHFDLASRNPGSAMLENVNQVLNDQRPLFVLTRKAHDIHATFSLADEFGFQPVLVGAHEAYQVIDQLVERNISVILEGPDPSSARGPEGSDLCWNSAGQLIEAGVPVALIGDNLLEYARFAHRFGLPAEQALHSVTKAPAELLGIDERVGSLAPGMDADLIAFTGEPLELTTAIRWVMVNGQVFEVQKEQ